MHNMDVCWRRAELSDLERIDEIADQIHVGLPERPEVFAEKVKLFPQGSSVLVADARIVGYGISHPWLLNHIPPLDAFLNGLPSHADCIYVHDVVVLPKYRGKRVTGSYIATVSNLALALNIHALALVSVYNTHPVWSRYGFRVIQPNAKLADKLHSYGETAKYMVCNLKDARAD